MGLCYTIGASEEHFLLGSFRVFLPVAMTPCGVRLCEVCGSLRWLYVVDFGVGFGGLAFLPDEFLIECAGDELDDVGFGVGDGGLQGEELFVVDFLAVGLCSVASDQGGAPDKRGDAACGLGGVAPGGGEERE